GIPKLGSKGGAYYPSKYGQGGVGQWLIDQAKKKLATASRARAVNMIGYSVLRDESACDSDFESNPNDSDVANASMKAFVAKSKLKEESDEESDSGSDSIPDLRNPTVRAHIVGGDSDSEDESIPDFRTRSNPAGTSIAELGRTTFKPIVHEGQIFMVVGKGMFLASEVFTTMCGGKYKFNEDDVVAAINELNKRAAMFGGTEDMYTPCQEVLGLLVMEVNMKLAREEEGESSSSKPSDSPKKQKSLSFDQPVKTAAKEAPKEVPSAKGVPSLLKHLEKSSIPAGVKPTPLSELPKKLPVPGSSKLPGKATTRMDVDSMPAPSPQTASHYQFHKAISSKSPEDIVSELFAKATVTVSLSDLAKISPDWNKGMKQFHTKSLTQSVNLGSYSSMPSQVDFERSTKLGKDVKLKLTPEFEAELSWDILRSGAEIENIPKEFLNLFYANREEFSESELSGYSAAHVRASLQSDALVSRLREFSSSTDGIVKHFSVSKSSGEIYVPSERGPYLVFSSPRMYGVTLGDVLLVKESVLDEGAEMNLAERPLCIAFAEAFKKEKGTEPDIDIKIKLFMNDANGGNSQLGGVIKNVKASFSEEVSVKTHLWIGPKDSKTTFGILWGMPFKIQARLKQEFDEYGNYWMCVHSDTTKARAIFQTAERSNPRNLTEFRREPPTFDEGFRNRPEI
ncbi:hypothetical protein HDU99_003010, partial [Rhizoclosmatium hyalinum]